MKQKIDEILNKRKNLMAIEIIADILLFMLSFVVAYYIEKTNAVTQDATLNMTLILAIPCAITTVAMMFFAKIYNIVWRYAGITDLLKLMEVGAFALGVGIVYRALFTFIYPVGHPMENCDRVDILVVISAYLFFFMFASCYRIARKAINSIKNHLKIKKKIFEKDLLPVIVYGGGSVGASLIKRLLEKPDEGYLPVAIIDDNKEKTNTFISNIPIIGGKEIIGSAIEKYNAKIIVIAIAKLTRAEMRKIFDHVKQFNVSIMIANVISDAKNTLDNDVISMRSIKIEDLLHRSVHELEQESVDRFIKDKVIMVTGGAGSIGSELCRQALYNGCKHLIIFDHHENGMFEFNEELKKLYEQDKYSLEVGSVRDRTKLKEVMERYKPDVVFHAAAYKHVPMMEISADEAVKNNVLGTKNVIEQCNESGVSKFILISTDKAINPANVMGATKRCAELVLQSYSKTSKTQLAAVRFGNVLGSSGSVIPTFIKQINSGGPVTVTDREMKRYFMTIPEAVRLVLQAGALAQGGEVFVLNMGEPVYIYDLASDLIRMSGLVPNKDIEIKINGLRPGEKLFEELQYGDENVDKTRHNDIFVCKLANVDEKEILTNIDKMIQTAQSGNKQDTEKQLFELVPSEYRKMHKNSQARV